MFGIISRGGMNRCKLKLLEGLNKLHIFHLHASERSQIINIVVCWCKAGERSGRPSLKIPQLIFLRNRLKSFWQQRMFWRQHYLVHCEFRSSPQWRSEATCFHGIWKVTGICKEIHFNDFSLCCTVCILCDEVNSYFSCSFVVLFKSRFTKLGRIDSISLGVTDLSLWYSVTDRRYNRGQYNIRIYKTCNHKILL